MSASPFRPNTVRGAFASLTPNRKLLVVAALAALLAVVAGGAFFLGESGAGARCDPPAGSGR